MQVLSLALLLMLPMAADESPATNAAAQTTDAAAPSPQRAPPPPGGSQVKPDEVFCVLCHTNKDQWDENDPKSFRLYLPEEKLRRDVHWQRGVNCHDCHGGNHDTDKLNVAHASEDGFVAKSAEIAKRCAECHKGQAINVRKSVHDKGGPKDDRGSGTLLGCDKCHGPVAHELLPVRDKNSPVFLDNQVTTCGGCHENYLESYKASSHGQGLYKLGLQVTAACADCHGAHGIYRPNDQRSTLSVKNVADTCGKCHRFIEERLQRSVHARAHGVGAPADRNAPGGNEKRTPTCTSCHEGHALVSPESAAFRLQSPNRCGNCHVNLSKQYAGSIHGQLTALGYAPGAKCHDCHGSHSIVPVDDPNSPLSPGNRQATCAKCHPRAGGNFLDFDPHADHTVAGRDPVLYWIYTGLMTLLITTFCVFGLHSALWFVRGLIHVWRHGRPRGLVPGETAYVRFVHFHRVAHTCLLISFLGLALTGLPLKYSASGWAKSLAACLGGFESTSTWHRIFALVTFGCLIVYVVRMARTFFRGRRHGLAWTKIVFGPDSPVPNWRDFKDFGNMTLWFVGGGPKPTFERWSYWEKFDFWGAITDIVIIGSTGLILWYPNLFCTFLPGNTLNIAKVVHSTQALLATGFVFAIHFFSTHLRAEKFPADMSVLTGLVSEEEMKEERPEYLERMRREGKLAKRQSKVPSRRYLWPYLLGGLAALAVGLSLLIAMIAAGLGH